MDAFHHITPTPTPHQIFTDAFHHVTPLLLKEGRDTILTSILVKTYNFRFQKMTGLYEGDNKQLIGIVSGREGFTGVLQ